MKITFLSESKMDSLLNGPFDEFLDGDPSDKTWHKLRGAVESLLSRYSHDEESEDADGSPGFLLQYEDDNTKTLGIEFNDPALLVKEVFYELYRILNLVSPSFQVTVTVYVNENMEFVVLKAGGIFMSKAVKPHFRK